VPPGPAGAPSRLPVLDGLRGVAVLLVLWYHVWEISFLPAPAAWLQFVPETGFIGVSLFFFLSGFVIAYPFVLARQSGRPQPSWRLFAWRRLLKIAPSYVLCIAVAYAIGYAQRQPGASTFPDVVTHLLFVHTWFPQRYGTIAGVLWTLSVEVEFYALFPLLWWAFRRAPWLTAGGMILAALAWRHAMAACCYAGVFELYEENLPGYLDVFAFGMLSAYVYGRFQRPQLRAVAPVVALAGVALTVALLRNLYAYRLEPLWSNVWQIDGRPLLALGFALAALGFLRSPRWFAAILDNPPLRWLAAISYNLYLYHQIIARELLRRHVPPYAGDPHFDYQWQIRYTEIAAGLSIAFAAVVTYAFERPLLRLPMPRLAGAIGRAPPAAWNETVSAEARSSKAPSRRPSSR
jgi:peptidoglycan/LPS O-acetylase OafA/YrhL